MTVESSTIKGNYVFGPLQFGGYYLGFFDADPRPFAGKGLYTEYKDYGANKFVSVSGNNTNFTLVFLTNGGCQIYYTNNYKKYYLCVDVDQNIVFAKESLLSFDPSTINPQDFTYIYSEEGNLIIIFKHTPTGQFVLTKTGDYLDLLPVIDNNIYSYTTSPFQISKNVYTYPNISPNTSFITYTNDNLVDTPKSSFNLTNNLLLHRKYSEDKGLTDIIILKNQLLQRDVFSSSNILLSGDYKNYAQDLRDYTSIGGSIKEEISEDLELNYVFYNKYYKIFPGSNVFVSPSSMYPFESLNINDSKLVESGAFSYTSPEYADKVYHLSDDTTNYAGGQYLLCTWLSGAPDSPNKVWVDRYYYPDLIDKQLALATLPILNYTYSDYIETLIATNVALSNAVIMDKIFDKRSDLIFTPNQSYQYDRLHVESLPSLSSTFIYCQNYFSNYPDNYFKQINQAGELTLGFDFMGDGVDWAIKSDRNDIDVGLNIEKVGGNITMSLSLYNAITEPYNANNIIEYAHQTASFSILKNNFVVISVNLKTGEGYFYINNVIINTFKIPVYQYLNKSLIYGDFFFFEGTTKTNLLIPQTKIQNVFITKTYTDPKLAFILPVLNGSIKIDDLDVTLPCGMRNSLDNIEFLQTVYGSSMFKSNNINIHVKNLNISNSSVINGVEQAIRTSITDMLPANTQINTVQFDNFK